MRQIAVSRVKRSSVDLRDGKNVFEVLARNLRQSRHSRFLRRRLLVLLSPPLARSVRPPPPPPSRSPRRSRDCLPSRRRCSPSLSSSLLSRLRFSFSRLLRLSSLRRSSSSGSFLASRSLSSRGCRFRDSLRSPS